VAALTAAFAGKCITITPEQARRPMGRHKKDHIRDILRMPEVAAQWLDWHDRPYTETDIDLLFDAFLPLQLEFIVQYADPIPGVVEAIRRLRRRGLKIGTTTGYTRVMMDVLAPEAARRGYAPDAIVCPDEVHAGRPHPWMCYQNAIALHCYPLAAFVKIGDTPLDIEEGLNAGMWTIGLTRCGNEVGLSEAECASLPAEALAHKLAGARERLLAAGAHYTAETLLDALPLLNEIDARLRQGESPV
jgi:phosphonoacetaldehyde hydrolase